MHTRCHKNSGFSLVELILHVGVTGGILVVVTLLFAQVTQTRVKNQTITEVNRQGARVIQTINQSIRSAESINQPSAGNQANKLSLEQGNVSKDPTVFAIDNGQLNITEGSSQSQPLTNDRVKVSDVSFANYSRADTPGVIQVEFTLSHINPNNRQPRSYTQEFQSAASLRANN